MKTWNITPEDPGQFTLAADARSTETRYTNDHIWELRHQNVEPPSLSVYTTYGLRARSFLVFPRFVENDLPITDPEKFSQPPLVHQFGPNFIQLSYFPLPGIKVEADYWVPASNTIGGRLKITNTKLKERQFRVEIAAVLTPGEEGKRMAPQDIEGIHVLAGKTQNLQPVLVLAGGGQPGTGPYPSLAFDLDLEAGLTTSFRWSLAAEEATLSSLETARETLQRKWDAELARAALLAESCLQVETGNRAWDIAFALGQKTAFGLFHSPTSFADFPAPSFVVNRTPDQGFSARGDGQDYQLNWSGQTPFQANYLISVMGLADPELARGILDNFLAYQKPDGFIPKKIGLAGQESDLLGMPIFVQLAWTLYQLNPTRSFLERAYPKLKRFLEYWFSADQDSDQDGIPEWSRARQSGFSEHPASISNPQWSTHPTVSLTEDPALCTFLVHEIQLLEAMAEILQRTDDLHELKKRREHLEEAIRHSYDRRYDRYYRWDRDSHHSPGARVLGQRTGTGPVLVMQNFRKPVRPLIELSVQETTPTKPVIFIHGRDHNQEHWVERITGSQFQWNLNVGKALGEKTYTSLEHIQIYGVHEKDEVTIHVANYRTIDISLLTPLWSGIPDPERAHVFIEETITDPGKFWSPHGLKATPQKGNDAVHLPWNVLVGKGLLNYGRRDKAAELVTNLMTAVVKNLKEQGAFYSCYDPETGRGLLEKNVVDGLPPLALFLETLGVQIISPHKVKITGQNPFPWPVTLRFRGTTIIRKRRKTIVTFSDGQTVQVSGPEARLITHQKE